MERDKAATVSTGGGRAMKKTSSMTDLRKERILQRGSGSFVLPSDATAGDIVQAKRLAEIMQSVTGLKRTEVHDRQVNHLA